MSRSAPAADDSRPISTAEADWLFRALRPFPALILAVSGGPDSTALLVLAARWRARLDNPPKLVAVTIDHGLRPESKREAKAVETLARKLGVEHRTLRWAGRKPTTGLQQAAREARYRLLAEAAREARAGHVLTAHTLDDQAETVLFRMARGSGVSGLAGMGPVTALPVEEGRGILLVRPLLDVAKSRLIATLKAEKIPYARDPSNRDPRFARSRLRTLMPALAREGLTAARLSALARRVQKVEDALFEALNDAQARIAPGPWPADEPVTIECEAFMDLPHEIATRLLGRVIAWQGDEGPVELGKLETLYDAMRDPLDAALNGLDHLAKFRRTLAGAVVTLAKDRITVERAPPRASRQTLTTRPQARRNRPKPR